MNRWKSEKEFVDRFVDVLGAGTSRTKIVREFRTGYGLPDVLVVRYSQSVLEKRKRDAREKYRGMFTVDCGHAMAYLARRRWVRLDTLKGTFHNMNGSFRTLIDMLQQRELVRVTGNRISARRKSDVFAIKTITVIEAKLRNWRRAVMQAQRHRWFTDNCHVLVPEPSAAHKGEISAACSKYNLGLMFFSREKGIVEGLGLKDRGPYNTYLAWLLNESIVDEVRDSGRGIRAKNR
jgi:hypothetical protein